MDTIKVTKGYAYVCHGCGGPRSYGSAKRCRRCYLGLRQEFPKVLVSAMNRLEQTGKIHQENGAWKDGEHPKINREREKYIQYLGPISTIETIKNDWIEDEKAKNFSEAIPNTEEPHLPVWKIFRQCKTPKFTIINMMDILMAFEEDGMTESIQDSHGVRCYRFTE